MWHFTTFEQWKWESRENTLWFWHGAHLMCSTFQVIGQFYILLHFYWGWEIKLSYYCVTLNNCPLYYMQLYYRYEDKSVLLIGAEYIYRRNRGETINAVLDWRQHPSQPMRASGVRLILLQLSATGPTPANHPLKLILVFVGLLLFSHRDQQMSINHLLSFFVSCINPFIIHLLSSAWQFSLYCSVYHHLTDFTISASILSLSCANKSNSEASLCGYPLLLSTHQRQNMCSVEPEAA